MNQRTGAKGALLDEYERALLELKQVASDVSPMELKLLVDKTTADQNCISIQSILTHVVYAGYTYANYVRKLKNAPFKLWEKAAHTVIADYNNDLDQMFSYTVETFGFFTEEETLQPTNKISTHWEQTYDIEQMWEHAIVHVLRHRRQIEKFKKTVR
ncbi:MAG TPA: hypothetical protein VLS85_01515 [Hanamia sp.]|nr:hypothetical protein [Hanamia sp.]